MILVHRFVEEGGRKKVLLERDLQALPGSPWRTMEQEGDASPLCSVVKETHIIADPLPDHNESQPTQ